ncbi:hypothetical protein HPB48_012374 [Haemaphysalis longicornis]|uniref:Glutamate-gated chloride channel n=1 Tax=Haemaphysalis longicornis TaxID=44386 RepID=A0A9J6G1J9_HAELO|nr:hypothetical protein HPB48_012374 [Haemaphysalis longicornis]
MFSEFIGTNLPGPLVVRTNLYVRSISDINDKKMEYSVQLTFRQQWKDERLKYNDVAGQLKYVNLDDPSKIWLPDTFFPNEISGHFHDLLQPNNLLRIYPDGEVLHSVRISLRLFCPMNLANFPFDRQVCGLTIASYAHTTEDIVFIWKQGDPVQVSRSLHVEQFALTKFLTDYCTSRTTTGEYACLKVDFMFERNTNEFVVKVYMPCVMLVLVSWVVLWLSNKNTAVRILVPLAVLLLMANMVARLNQEQFPRTSYTKAVDTWTGTCLTFVFLLLLYVTTVDYVARVTNSGATSAHSRDESKASYSELTECVGYGLSGCVVEEEASKASPGSSTFQQALRAFFRRPRTLPDKMDFGARIAFPACFCLFLIIYFSVHGGGSADE